HRCRPAHLDAHVPRVSDHQAHVRVSPRAGPAPAPQRGCKRRTTELSASRESPGARQRTRRARRAETTASDEPTEEKCGDEPGTRVQRARRALSSGAARRTGIRRRRGWTRIRRNRPAFSTTLPGVSLLRRGAELARRLLSWLLRQDLFVVTSIGGLCALTWAFAELADAVRQEETRSVDERVLRALRSDPAGLDPIGPDWVARAMVDISALGSPAVTTLIVIVVAGFLVLGKKPRLAVLVIASALASAGSMLALKALFDRGRPAVVARITEAAGLSFPSGHAAVSAALYATLGVLLARVVPGIRLRVYVVLVGAAIAFLIGAT